VLVFSVLRVFYINFAMNLQVLSLGRMVTQTIFFVLCFHTVISAVSLSAQTQTYRLIETIKIGQKLGQRFQPTLQPCAIGIDEQQHRAYLASAISPNFPILDIDSAKQVGVLSAPFTPNGERLSILVNPTNSLLYFYSAETPHDSLKTIYAVNPAQNLVVATCSYSAAIRDIALHHRQNRLYVADGSVLRVLDGATLEQKDTLVMPFVIGCIALDSLHDRLYAVAKEPTAGQGRFTMHTLTSPHSLVKTLTFPNTAPVLRAFVDTNWNRFLLATPTQVRIFQLGSNAPVKTVPLNGTYSQFIYAPSNERFYAMNDNGYAANGERGQFGKLLSLGFIDETRDSVRLGLKPSGLALDETRARLAVVAEQQATVFWYDMNTLKPDMTTELAFHFDDLALAPDGLTMYLANHLGKSQRLWLYSFIGQELNDVPTGTWTTTFATDSARGRIFALAHQENAVYILSTFTNTAVGKTPIFGFKEQRSEALSTMCFDRAKQKMYVAMPEHKSIAVLDLATSATEKSLKIWGYNFSERERGLGKIQMVFAPSVNKLYVLRTNQKRLNIYNLNTSVLTDSLNLANHWTPTMSLWSENLLTFDAVGKRIFVGGVGIDCNTNKVSGKVLSGAARFLGYNSKETILYSIAQSGTALIVQEHDPQTLAVTASRPLYNTSEAISPLVYLDSRRNQLHLLDRLEGVLHRYDVKNLVGAAIAKTDGEGDVTLSVFPNPVNSQATVRFGVKRREKVRLAVYDSVGREVSVLTEQEYEPGTHTITLKIESTSFTTQNYTLRLKSATMSYTKVFQVQK